MFLLTVGFEVLCFVETFERLELLLCVLVLIDLLDDCWLAGGLVPVVFVGYDCTVLNALVTTVAICIPWYPDIPPPADLTIFSKPESILSYASSSVFNLCPYQYALHL